MGTSIGDAFLTLRIDRAQAERDARTSAQGIAGIFQSAVGAIAVADVFKDSIKSASDLNAALAKTKTVFGDNAAEAEKFGKTADKNFGLSEAAAARVTSSLGNLLINLGFTGDEALKTSETIVQVGADLGAAFNKDTADVVDALTKGIAGQTRGLKAYGIVLNDVNLKAEAEKEGLYNGKGALDAHAKAAASLALILQQTTKFQGDFAASADTVATSQRIAAAEAANASASLGQNFLPIYQKIVVIVGAAAKAFATLPGPIQVGVLALGALVALAGPIGVVVGVIEDLTVAIGAMELAGGEIIGVLALLGAVAVAFFALTGGSDNARTSASHFTDALKQSTAALVNNSEAAVLAFHAVNDLTPAFKSLSEAILKALPSVGGKSLGAVVITDLGKVGLTATDTAKTLSLLGEVLQDKTVTSAQNVTNTFKGLNQAQKDFLANLLVTAPGINEYNAALEKNTGPGKLFDDTTKQAGTALLSLYEIANSTDGIGKIANTFTDAARGANDFTAGILKQAEANLKANGTVADGVPLYEEYLRIASALPPEQQKQALALDTTTGSADAAALALGDVGAATDTATSSAESYDIASAQLKATQDANKTSTSNLSDAISKSTNEFERAKAAADSFSKALDSVFSPALDLEKANEALNQGLIDITKNVADAKKGHDKLATSLDVSTDTGNKNRASIEKQVEAIIAKTKADVASGVSVQDATNASALYRQQLENTLAALGFNKDAVKAYIDQLGLTPENVKTAIQLEHDSEVKDRLQGLLKQLGDIDAGAAANIQAEIDKGSFDQAELDLEQLARTRQVLLTTRTVTGSGPQLNSGAGGRSTVASAAGRYIPGGSNLLTTTAEIGGPRGDEAIMPLGDPGRMREIAAQGGTGERIMAALGGGSTTGVHIDKAYFNNGTDAEGVAQLVLLKLSAAG